MDRHLKERLVGAAVLVAVAIILIPEMLSGPRDLAPGGQVAPQSDGGMKTVTIDLNAPKVREAEPPAEQPIEIAPAPQSDENAPAPAQLSGESSAQVAVQPAPQLPAPAQSASNLPASNSAAANPAATERSGAGANRVPVPERSAEKTVEPAGVKPMPKPAEKPPEKQGERPVEKPSAPAGGGWAVQVASFGQRSKSEGIADDLKAKGFSAYVMPFVVKEQTMYRVRVGPVRDRAAAESLLQKVKPLHPNAAIVTQ